MRMFEVQKTLEFAGAHQLDLPYESPCTHLHGHNWVVTLYLQCLEGDRHHGMVEDFATIKKRVMSRYDHKQIEIGNGVNTTAENIAACILDMFPKCYKVEVRESNNNVAIAYDAGRRLF